MKSLFEKNGGTYTRVGDYYLPNLEAPNGNYKIGNSYRPFALGCFGQKMSFINSLTVLWTNRNRMLRL